MQNTFSQSGNDSKWFLTKIIFQNRYVALETPSRPPPPFMANAILNFHFDFPHPSLRNTAGQSAKGDPQVEVHPKVLVLPSNPSGRILASPAQATSKHLIPQGHVTAGVASCWLIISTIQASLYCFIAEDATMGGNHTFQWRSAFYLCPTFAS